MKNDFDSIFRKDLLPTIDQLAFDCQRPANLLFTHCGDEQLLLIQNASIAAYNRGVLAFREALRKALGEDDEDA